MEPTEPRQARSRFLRDAARLTIGLAILLQAGAGQAAAPPPFDRFDLPDAWEARFWSSPNVKNLLKLNPEEVAALVPDQAGIRFCRCPHCDATEADDSLEWSVAQPEILTCRHCEAKLAIERCLGHEKKGDTDEKKKPVPEETVEVRPGVIHHYPYVEVAPETQQYPDERLYLAAHRDHEAREFLSKFALYAAVRHREQPSGRKDPEIARLAAVILVQFARVYPSYSTHFDQPRSPKYFDKADLTPPYRSGYRSARWDWTGSQDVPLNLVVAYALLRGEPSLA